MRTPTNWFPTFTGIKFYPTDPLIEDICIEDIAHSLSLQCRFAGHVESFYSVAQHSVLVSHGVSPSNALAGLLHDAAEAYCQDLIRPVKMLADFKAYRDIERILSDLICKKFNVDIHTDEIKLHDNRALMTERRDLYKPSPADSFDWGITAKPYPGLLIPDSPKEAEANFLKRYRQLQEIEK